MFIDIDAYQLLENAYVALKEVNLPEHKKLRISIRNTLKTAHITERGNVAIGYWFKFNKPVEDSNNLTEEQMKLFTKKFSKLLCSGSRSFYKGSSICRICGKLNGSSEIKAEYKGYTFVIPDGYTHYIHAHNVRPDSFLLSLMLNIYK
jgi:hypothetical protein